MIHRYENFGIYGLKERNSTPKNHPNKTKEIVEKSILKLKEKYQRWGAKKIENYCLTFVLKKIFQVWLWFIISCIETDSSNLRSDLKESSLYILFSTQKCVMKFGVQIIKESF